MQYIEIALYEYVAKHRRQIMRIIAQPELLQIFNNVVLP